MQRDFLAYLCDMYNAADDIVFFTLGFNEEMFESVGVVQAAVERKFEIIGEAMTQCRAHHPSEIVALGDIQSIIDFRNFLAHRYDSVSHAIVWDILQNDIPPLIDKLKILLEGNKCRRA